MALFRELFETPSYMYTAMLKNRVNGYHGNHAFFHSSIEFIFEEKILCISGVPMNDLAPMKNCPGGAR